MIGIAARRGSPSHILRSCLMLLFLSQLFLPLLSQAQLVKPGEKEKKGLKIKYFPDALKPRSSAPMGIEVRFSGVEPGEIIEGRLRLQYRDGNSVTAMFESPELALASGTSTYRFMVPEAHTSGYTTDTKVQCVFITAKKTIDLGTISTPLPNKQNRTMVIAASIPSIGEYANLQEIINLMKDRTL